MSDVTGEAEGQTPPPGPFSTGSAVRQAGELRSARVESLRAVAALAVLEGHVYGASVAYGLPAYTTFWHRALFGGGFGVYLFFCLSGYLLYLPFARRSFGGGRPVDLGRYARNRALRILPLYYVVVVTYLAVTGAPARHWALLLTFCENFSRATVGRIDGAIWSLVVEVMFYALLPLLAAGVARLSGGSLRRAVAVLGVIGVMAGLVRWLLFLRVVGPSPLVQYNLPVTFYFFVPGMLLALAKVASERSGARRPAGPAARSWLWVTASAALWALTFYRYRWDLAVGPASFLLLGACVLPLRDSLATRALAWRPLALLGTASYSLYLWHLPIVDRLASSPLGGFPGHLVLVGGLCVAIAAVSYRLIETPFLRLRRRWGETEARAAGSRR